MKKDISRLLYACLALDYFLRAARTVRENITHLLLQKPGFMK